MKEGFSELLVLLVVTVIFISTIFVANQTGAAFTLIRGSSPVLTVAQPVATPDPHKDWLLPDMKLAPPKKLYIQRQGNKKIMRFDTTFSNVGRGPLELIGETDSVKGVVVATQRIYKTDGETEEQIVGEFVLHPTHKHWHVDKYAQFQIYSYDTSRNPINLLASTDKFSFCIWDEHTSDLNLPGAPKSRQYPRCPKNIQGNSVGWGDTYTANTDGQEIDITGIPDGNYLVMSSVNPSRSILESDYSNNTAILFIEIIGNSVTIID